MNRILVVVDYQNDFVNGSLGFDGAQDIENNIVSLIKDFKKNGDMIYFTKDTHLPNYLQTVEGKYLPITHCVKGTKGWDFTYFVQKEVEYYPVIEKETFGSLLLGNMLSGLYPSEIHLCGLVSDICVFTNAIIVKSACPNAEIYIHKNATSSNNLDMQEKAFELAEHLHIHVVD